MAKSNGQRRVVSHFAIPLGFGDTGDAGETAASTTAALAPATPAPAKQLASYFLVAVAAGVAVWWLTQRLGGKKSRARYSGGPRIVHSHFVESDGPEEEDEEDEVDTEEDDEEGNS